MKLQERGYTCGPAALRAALYILGHNLTEASLSRRAGTTKDGTDERGIMRAVGYYGHTARPRSFHSSKKAWSWLKRALSMGRPVLICSDSWEHWMVIVGTLGGKLLVFDPDSSPGRRKKYSGLAVYNAHDLGTRWQYVDEDTGIVSYYAIAIS